MGPGRRADRLLPRYVLGGGIAVEWDVRTTRRRWPPTRDQEISEPAVMREVSLEGALIEVSGGEPHKTGDKVAIRVRDVNGVATVKHVRTAEDAPTLYGVRFVPAPALTEVLAETVTLIRGRKSELDNAWQRQN